VPLTDNEFDLLAQELKQIADLDLTFLVQDHEGQTAGMALSLTDLCGPLLKAYPRPGVPEWWTTLKLLWHWKVRHQVKGVRVTLLGVLEPHRGKGVDALLIYESTMGAIRKGYEWGEMSWILETNDMMNRGIALMNAEVYKTYRIYQKPL
jgi:GNAT superfamily N-acetyltransferase